MIQVIGRWTNKNGNIQKEILSIKYLDCDMCGKKLKPYQRKYCSKKCTCKANNLARIERRNDVLAMETI